MSSQIKGTPSRRLPKGASVAQVTWLDLVWRGFARGADDIADEGEMPDAERLARLDEYLAACDAMEAGVAPAARFAR